MPGAKRRCREEGLYWFSATEGVAVEKKGCNRCGGPGWPGPVSAFLGFVFWRNGEGGVQGFKGQILFFRLGISAAAAVGMCGRQWGCISSAGCSTLRIQWCGCNAVSVYVFRLHSDVFQPAVHASGIFGKWEFPASSDSENQSFDKCRIKNTHQSIKTQEYRKGYSFPHTQLCLLI